MEVTVQNLEPTKVVYKRHVGPYQDVDRAWKTVCAWAAPKGLLGPKTRYLGVCYDDPEVTEATKIRYDACISVETDVCARR